MAYVTEAWCPDEVWWEGILRIFAAQIGRVFSGKVSNGTKVKIMGPNFVPGEKKDLTSRVSRELSSAYVKVITSVWNLWFLVNQTEPIGSELES